MSGEIEVALALHAPPLPLVQCPERLAIERAFLEDNVAAGLGGDPTRFDPRLSAPAACARLARSRDPLGVAEAFALALSDPLVAAERGTFDRLARDLRASFAALYPAAANRFAAHLDTSIDELGEATIEWAPPAIPPGAAKRHNSILAVAGTPVTVPDYRHDHGANPTLALMPPVVTAGPLEAKEEAIVSAEKQRDSARRGEGKAAVILDWRAQLAAVAAELPMVEEDREGATDKSGQRIVQIAMVATPPPATIVPAEPLPDLDTLRARRARIVDADRKRRAATEAVLAERQTLLAKITTRKSELVTIRRERELVEEALATAYTAEARGELAALVTEVERLCGVRVAALATVEGRLASLDRRPEVAALLAGQDREDREMPDVAVASAAIWRRRRPEAVAASATGRLTGAQDQQLASGGKFPHEPVCLTVRDTGEQRAADGKRAAILDAVEGARRLLRAGDADDAIALLSGIDPRGVDREVERQAVGVLFAAAESAARANGMADFRYLRLDRGQRVLLACEPATAYRLDNVPATPVYRVVATYGAAGDRFKPGQAIPARLLKRAQPRRARS